MNPDIRLTDWGKKISGRRFISSVLDNKCKLFANYLANSLVRLD